MGGLGCQMNLVVRPGCLRDDRPKWATHGVGRPRRSELGCGLFLGGAVATTEIEEIRRSRWAVWSYGVEGEKERETKERRVKRKLGCDR
ncbi:hypothetical protein GOBAR_DD04525 [Gossypium barbadense]|nr:hypothetical protein GOBAR_DD04525 [Gossypium barbadense]